MYSHPLFTMCWKQEQEKGPDLGGLLPGVSTVHLLRYLPPGGERSLRLQLDITVLRIWKVIPREKYKKVSLLPHHS